MENANKKFRYSIRKFKVGVGSVLIATCLLGAGVSTPTAFATTETSTATQVEAAQPTSETEPTVQITGTVSTENTNSESKVAPEVKEEAPVAEKAETATKSAEQKVASEPEKTEEPTPAPAALTSEAKEEVSAKTQENVEVKNSPLQDVQNLLKDVERELEELEVFTEYDASVYWYQKSLWEQFSEIGKREMDRVLTLKEDSAEIKKYMRVYLNLEIKSRWSDLHVKLHHILRNILMMSLLRMSTVQIWNNQITAVMLVKEGTLLRHMLIK